MLNHVADFCYTTQHTWFGHGDLHVWSIFGRALVLYIYIWWIGLFLVVFWAIEYLRGCMAWLHRKFEYAFHIFFWLAFSGLASLNPNPAETRAAPGLPLPYPSYPYPPPLGFGLVYWPVVISCIRIWMHHDSIILELISSQRKSCFELISIVKGNMISNW